MSKRTIAISAALVLAIGAVFVGPAFAAAPAIPQRLLDQLANCQDDKAAAKTPHRLAWAEDCEGVAQDAIDAYVAAHPTPTGSVLPTTTTVLPTATATGSTTPPATTPPATTPPATTPPPTTAPPAAWPDATNTGVPAGTTLTAYTGPCTITAANTVIDAKTISCSTLTINADNVRVTRSKLTGTGDPQISVSAKGTGFVISDSTLAVGLGSTGIQDRNWSGLRLNIFGGNRGAYCASTCTLRDSWVHGTRNDAASGQHASGVRAEQYTTFDHNSLACDLPASSGACSADVTMYADFAPIHDVRVTNNRFLPDPSATFCMYGGDTQGKKFSNDPANATNIVFTGNVFVRGCFGDPQGRPVASFDSSGSGNVWKLNVWSTGETVPPSQ